MEHLQELLVEQLKDLYSAENQLVEALPKAAKACSSKALQKGLLHHLDETKGQVKRLERISKVLQTNLGGKSCVAMKGLVKEASEVLGEDYDSAAVKDAMIVSIAQKIEHYEIAGYGNAHTVAMHLRLREVAGLLKETLQEEKDADRSLTKVTREHIFSALSEEAEDEADDSSRSTIRRSASL